MCVLTWVWKGHFLSETWESPGTQKTLLSAELQAPHDARLQIFLSWDVITGSLRRDPPMAGRKAEEDDFKWLFKGLRAMHMDPHQDIRIKSVFLQVFPFWGISDEHVDESIQKKIFLFCLPHSAWFLCLFTQISNITEWRNNHVH